MQVEDPEKGHDRLSNHIGKETLPGLKVDAQVKYGVYKVVVIDSSTRPVKESYSYGLQARSINYSINMVK